MVAEKETTVIKSGGNGMAIVLLAIAIVIAAGVAFMSLQNDNAKTDAVTGAAQSVSDTAKDVGDAVKPDK